MAAPLGAIFHVIPAVGPFFAPGEGQPADWTDFGGEIGLGTLASH